jgi:hypothetical protein
VRRLAATCLVAALSLLLAASIASARDPRLERLRLNAADVALAKRIALKRSDLGGSWQQVSVPASGDGEGLNCPNFNPDLSRFTITGEASTGFTQQTGASILSAVEVYPSRAEAAGDFRTGARPEVARCLRLVLERDLPQNGLLTFKVLSSRVVAAPRVGDRRIAYRLVARLESLGTRVDLFLDVVVVQRGRSIAALFFTSPTKPLAGQARLAAAVAARMR